MLNAKVNFLTSWVGFLVTLGGTWAGILGRMEDPIFWGEWIIGSFILTLLLIQMDGGSDGQNDRYQQ